MSVTLALETDTRRMLQAEGSPGLYSGTQDTLGHIVEPSLKNRRRKKKKQTAERIKTQKLGTVIVHAKRFGVTSQSCKQHVTGNSITSAFTSVMNIQKLLLTFAVNFFSKYFY